MSSRQGSWSVGSDANGIKPERERDPLGLDRARPEHEVGPMDGSGNGAAGHLGSLDSDDHEGPHERWPSIRMSTGSNAGGAAPPPPNPDISRFAGGTPSDSDASLHLNL